MKILIVSGSSVFDNLAGSEMQMRGLGEYLLGQGHDVVYYFREFFPHKAIREVYEGSVIYRNTRSHGRVLGLMRDAERLVAVVREELPDVLYARCFRSVYVLDRGSRMTGVPFVYQFPFALDHRFFGFTQLKNIRKSIPLTAYGYFSRRALKNAAKVLTVSHDEAKVLEEVLGLNAQTIYNMHPVPNALQNKESPPLVVWINNIKSIKRPELFVELASRCQDVNARFVMSGRMGNGKSDQILLQRIESIKNLEYIGPTMFSAANAMLEKASINIVTSLSEGFPNGTIQGWFRETPTVSTVDKDQVITRNKIGFHVYDLNDMEAKLRFLLSSPDECVMMGQRARRYAIANHSIKSQGPKYLEVFEHFARIG